MAQAELARKTNETDIKVSVNLEGSGKSDINTGIGFFDHMLTHLAKHGGFDISVQANGDLEVDGHHTVEDVGICLGQVFLKAVGDTAGLTRFGHAVIPMDEALAEATIDFSGRPFLVFNVDLPNVQVGTFDAELTEEFFRALAVNARLTLHINLRYATNVHHAIEGIFKAVARALGQALYKKPGVTDVPSTKGMLET